MISRPDHELFHKRLRQVMKEKGLTQKELAQLSELNLSTVKNYTAENTVPNPDNLMKLAAALDVSPDWLTGASEFRSKEVQAILNTKIKSSTLNALLPDIEKQQDRFNLYIQALDLMDYDIKPLVDDCNSDDEYAPHPFKNLLYDVDNYVDMAGNKYLQKGKKTMMNAKLQETINAALAKNAGIEDFQEKLEGRKEFTATDIKALQDALDLTVDQVQHLFF